MASDGSKMLPDDPKRLPYAAKMPCTGLGDPLGMMELCKYTIIWKTICS